MKEAEKSVDPQLWHVCAGGMVQMPDVNSKVFYFPQGHAEHSHAAVDFAAYPRIAPLYLSRVSAVKFLADSETDDVYAKISLIPLGNNELDLVDDVIGNNGSDNQDKSASFAKTLTQSDANNGGGFSVPRYCAETIFPRLDYSADPPVQTVIAKDVRGQSWKFRHIYRGTPRRHLLTTGWSTFVNHKKLVAGDSIVFLRADNGDLCVGIRRANRGIGGEHEYPSGWNSSPGSCVSPYGGLSRLLKEDENKLRSGCFGNSNSGSYSNFRERGRVNPESVIEAASRAANGQPFEVVYYPRASAPEFCIKASSVKTAMRIQWSSGMRFKMAFETEDSSRISWFMGTIASVQVVDPIRWPNSPWRLLQVTWDEPDLLQNVKCISPWLVELVSNVPAMHMSPFLPPRKKLRIPQHPDFPFDGQFPMPLFSGNPLGPSNPVCCLSDNTPAGIQGARHAQFGLSLMDLHLSNKLQPGQFPSSFQQFNPHSRISDGMMTDQTSCKDNLSSLLTTGHSSQNMEKCDNKKRHQFVLFGQPILTEQQLSCGRSNGSVKDKDSPDGSECAPGQQDQQRKTSSMGFLLQHGFRTTELGLDTDHCKVFMESEDVGRSLDLSVLGSYEELYCKLTSMFGIEIREMMSQVIYRDATGSTKRMGDESFSDFAKTAKRLTILMNPSSDKVGRTTFTGLLKADKGLDSPNKTGPLSISA